MVQVTKAKSEAEPEGPRYELEADHFLHGDKFVLAGTVVGAGTPYPMDGVPPSQHMRPLNEAAEALCEARRGVKVPNDLQVLVK